MVLSSFFKYLSNDADMKHYFAILCPFLQIRAIHKECLYCRGGINLSYAGIVGRPKLNELMTDSLDPRGKYVSILTKEEEGSPIHSTTLLFDFLIFYPFLLRDRRSEPNRTCLPYIFDI